MPFIYVTGKKGVAARVLEPSVTWLAFKEEGLMVRDPLLMYFPFMSHGCGGVPLGQKETWPQGVPEHCIFNKLRYHI